MTCAAQQCLLNSSLSPHPGWQQILGWVSAWEGDWSCVCMCMCLCRCVCWCEIVWTAMREHTVWFHAQRPALLKTLLTTRSHQGFRHVAHTPSAGTWQGHCVSQEGAEDLVYRCRVPQWMVGAVILSRMVLVTGAGQCLYTMSAGSACGCVGLSVQCVCGLHVCRVLHQQDSHLM